MRFTVLNADKVKEFHKQGRSVILAFWHGRLLMIPAAYMGKGVSILISMHSDGEIISKAMELFNFSSVRGSTTRGGAKALIGLVKAAKAGQDIAITPDGPKGPRYVAQSGAIILAKMTGAPIFPITYGASRKKQFSSWDGFVLPHLFSKGVFIWGDPIFVDKDSGEDEMEKKRIELEESLNAITKKADSYF